MKAKRNPMKNTQDNTLHSRLMMQGSTNDKDFFYKMGLKKFDKWAYLLYIRLIYVFYSDVPPTFLEYKTFKID